MRVNLVGETLVARFWNERERDGEKAHEGLATAESQQTMMKTLKIFAGGWKRSGGWRAASRAGLQIMLLQATGRKGSARKLIDRIAKARDWAERGRGGCILPPLLLS